MSHASVSTRSQGREGQGHSGGTYRVKRMRTACKQGDCRLCAWRHNPGASVAKDGGGGASVCVKVQGNAVQAVVVGVEPCTKSEGMLLQA
eukprot:182166-Amphidinium_carterae.2